MCVMVISESDQFQFVGFLHIAILVYTPEPESSGIQEDENGRKPLVKERAILQSPEYLPINTIPGCLGLYSTIPKPCCTYEDY